MNTKLRTTTVKAALGALMLATMINVSPAIADSKGGDDKKTEKVSTVDSVMIEELVVELDLADELELLESVQTPPVFQVYDADDQLVFSGNQKQWNDAKNKKLVMIKRKAEYLFETDGTHIYKLF